MPEAAVVGASKSPSGGKQNGGAYVDRDKPAQIRYSNISAGKGPKQNSPPLYSHYNVIILFIFYI